MRDLFHFEVREALEKDGWEITHDPFSFEVKDSKFQIDLGAERLIGAQKNNEKIAVEIKTFLAQSLMSAFHLAVGQYGNYQIALENYEEEKGRTLFLAIPEEAWLGFFQRDFIKMVVKQKKIKLLIYEPSEKIIVKWIR